MAREQAITGPRVIQDLVSRAIYYIQGLSMVEVDRVEVVVVVDNRVVVVGEML